jgi:alanine racemase
MTRPIIVTIHKKALRHNFQVVRKAAGGRAVWAVVKANAYGHGLRNAVEAFSEADGLALLEVSEAVRARECGWTKRILLLEGFFSQKELPEIEQHEVETIVHSAWMIDVLKRNAPFKNLRCHIKINTGMNRLGFRPEEYQAVVRELSAIAGVTVCGAVTHFANAEPTYTKGGPATFEKQLGRMSSIGSTQGEKCLANSAATLFHPEVGGDAVRAGVILYGASPDSNISERELHVRPAMTFSAKIIAIQNIQAGDAVGYGSRWTASRPSRIAVVACGYADGYPRSMPNGAPTWVEGKIAPLVGATSMDMLEIDVTDVPEATVGSIVELWGEHIPVNQVAKLCGTIGYELLCALAPRVNVRVDEE